MRSVLVALLAMALWLPAPARAQDDRPAAVADDDADADDAGQAHRLWLEGGLGAGQLDYDTHLYGEGGTGLAIALLAGARVTPRWSVGLQVSGVGLKASNSNYDPQAYGSSVWGEAISGVQAIAQFEPRRDHGWFYGGGAGTSYYHNKPLEDSVGRRGGRIGDGSGFTLRIGYDWPQGSRGHLQAMLSVDTGHIGLDAPVYGSFRYTSVNAGLSVALR